MVRSRWQDVMDGLDYRIAASRAVSLSLANDGGGVTTMYLWMRSAWSDRPAMALLQVNG